jgi:DNA invertase Pin-like site-specific DNA recombinase
VPSLAKDLNVPIPAVRRPGSVWVELPRPVVAGVEPVGHVRIGYARASTVRQSLDTQLDSLKEAGVSRVFSEKISTRVTSRPELERAVTLAREMRASGVAVTLVVHEHKRLGRGIELAVLAEQLKAAGIGLEFLTGELQGSRDPSGIVFTVLAALSGMEREYIRDRTLEGHESARTRGKSIARRWRRGRVVRGWRRRAGRAGRHPSPATVLRMLREHDEKTAAAPAG